MRTCFETAMGDADMLKLGYGIKLEQRANGKFRVTYGKQVDDGLDYANAALHLGASIMHALACEGKLDNTGD